LQFRCYYHPEQEL